MTPSTHVTEAQAARYTQTRRLSIKEGAGATVMSSVGEAYIVPYAIELQAQNVQLGILSSLAALLGPIAQIFGSRLIERFHRKQIVFVSVLLQASTWLLFIGLGLWFLRHGPAPYLFPLLAIAYVLYALFGALSGPAWFSLIGDAVPEKLRSRYFARRNWLLGFVSVGSTLLGALWLHAWRDSGLIIGFIGLFIVAGLGRLVSAYYLRQHHVLPIHLDRDYYFSFWRFVKKIPHYNFNRFTLYVSLMNFSTGVAGPFFAVYLWKELKFNPIWYTAVIVSGSVSLFLFSPLWGRFADRYGNRELLRLGSLIVIPGPLFWLISQRPLFLMFVPQLLAGMGWSAFLLASSNFIYDSIEPSRRALCVAYYNLLGGIGTFCGALLGGLLTQYVHLSYINVFFLIFIISSSLRLLVTSFVLPHVSEVRTEHHPARLNPLYYLKEIKPLEGSFWDNIYPLKRSRLVRWGRR